MVNAIVKSRPFGRTAFLLLVLAGNSIAVQATDEARATPVHANTAGHFGPAVAPGPAGPARFVDALYDRYDAARVAEQVAFNDALDRTPGSEAYESALKYVSDGLEELGFGQHPEFELNTIDTPLEDPVWEGKSAALTLRVDGTSSILSSFCRQSDRDRVMLPLNAPSADVMGRPVFALDLVQQGTILVTGARLSENLIKRAERRGALAILSSELLHFSVDPTGAKRHEEAIQRRTVPVGTTLPVGHISPKSHRAIEYAKGRAFGATVALTAETKLRPGKRRTLVASIVGKDRPDEAVVIAIHVTDPGVGSNAAGVLGCLRSLLQGLKSGTIMQPSRTVVFVWGELVIQVEDYLAHTTREVIAGISADMLGQSRKETGAIGLLERMKDPGAVHTLEPDRHSAWGAGEVDEADLAPNGLALIARAAFVDVSEKVGGWQTAENPWEGGSDHDVFLDRGIPAVLFWHFTDFTFNTSLDRMNMVDPEELRRSSVAVLATALAVADPAQGDLERYLASNELERDARLSAAADAEEPAAAGLWDTWCNGASEWLKKLCTP